MSEGNLRAEEAQAIIQYLRGTESEEQYQCVELLGGLLIAYFEKHNIKLEPLTTAKEFIECWDLHPMRPTPNFLRQPSIPLFLAYSKPSIQKKLDELLYSLDPYDDLPDSEIKWKLDKSENSDRMRRRLKRFHNAPTHAGCAKEYKERDKDSKLLEKRPEKVQATTPDNPQGDVIVTLAPGISISYENLKVFCFMFINT